MKFTVTIELQHLEGPAQDEETLLDFFAAAVGKDNGSKQPVRVVVPDAEGGSEFGGVDSVYEVKLVDAP